MSDATRRELLARLDKPSTLGKGLGEDQMNRLQAATRARYEEMAPFLSARNALFHHLDRTVTSGLLCPRDARRLKGLTRRVSGLYLNPHQYHSAVHALSVAREALILFPTSELTSRPDVRRVCLRLVLAGLYHDTGNGAFPAAPGVDEVEATEIFLRDVQEARKGRRSDDPRSLLAELTDDEIVTVVGAILGTVFRDRHASFVQLVRLPVDSGRRQVDYVGDAVSRLRELGQEADLEVLARRMTSSEAWILKNADILESLRPGFLLKNGITCFHEDTLKDPEEFGGQTAAQHRNGFLRFLRGDFHPAADGDGVTDPLLRARQGALLQGSDEIEEYGRRLTEVSTRAFERLHQQDGAILDALHAAIWQVNRPGNAGRRSVLVRPLSELREILIEILGVSAATFDASYGAPFSRHATRCLAEMLPHEVNETFGCRTLARHRTQYDPLPSPGRSTQPIPSMAR